MLPPPPYLTLLITLNAILVASSAIFFSTYHRSQDFFRQVSLAGIFFLRIVTPPPVISNGPSLGANVFFLILSGIDTLK